jgi:hypothetical protein
MANILQQVQTYQDSGLAYLVNSFCYINLANKKFKDFEKIEANLGDTVTFDLPPRYTTSPSLVAVFQDSEQRVQSLTIGKAANTAYQFSAQEFIFNAERYMNKFGKSAVLEIGTQVESDVARVNIDNTYRFFGDAVTPINSYTQLAQALALFRTCGSAKDNTRGIVPDINIPAITGTGLQQFTLARNNQIAMSWELGAFSRCEWYQSNLLPIHQAGNVGEDALTLTFVSVDPTGTLVTFSGAAASDPDAIKAGDLFQFNDGVPGFSNMRYLTFIGHVPSASPVQFRAEANAASNAGGQVTVTVFPALISTVGSKNQNLNQPLVAGMQAKVLPSHRAGLIYSGDALYLGMPRLPEEVPFPTSNKMDSDSGASMRMYYGSLFGQNQRGFIHDVIWGSTLVDEYSMRLVFPI